MTTGIAAPDLRSGGVTSAAAPPASTRSEAVTRLGMQEAASAAGSGPPASRPRKHFLLPRLRRRLLWALVAAILSLLLFRALRPRPIQVEAARAVSGPLETMISAEGVTRVRDRYLIAAPFSGRLERLTLRAGDAVEAGAVVARITPVPLDPQTLLQAQSRLAGAQASFDEASIRVRQTGEILEQARRTAARIRTVAAEGAVSMETLDRAELALATAEREYEAAQSRMRAAETEVSGARAALLNVGPERNSGDAIAVMRSPAAGRVLRIPDASERVLTAGTVLLEIADPTALEVVVDVLSTDAVKVLPGMPMRLRSWGGEEALQARVDRLEPAGFRKVSALGVEEQRVNVIGELIVPSALGDGYRVEAQIVTWTATDVVKIPTSALSRSGAEWKVFVVENGRARSRAFQIGHRGSDDVEVIEGISVGDDVITFPSDRVRDGVRVTLK